MESRNLGKRLLPISVLHVYYLHEWRGPVVRAVVSRGEPELEEARRLQPRRQQHHHQHELERALAVAEKIQGDTSGCDEPPVDFKTRVPFWPGLPWLG